MSITKTSLRNHMENRFKESRGRFHKEIDSYYKETIEPALDEKLTILDKSIKQASKISDEFAKFQEDNRLNEYYYSRYISDLTSYINIKSNVKGRELGEIRRAVKVDKPYTKFGLSDQVEVAKKELSGLFRKLDDVDKLENEVTTVINNAASGKKAFNDLKTLGIDMSGYKEESANLPAIQKFSVDTCLVNGGCE